MMFGVTNSTAIWDKHKKTKTKIIKENAHKHTRFTYTTNSSYKTGNNEWSQTVSKGMTSDISSLILHVKAEWNKRKIVRNLIVAYIRPKKLDFIWLFKQNRIVIINNSFLCMRMKLRLYRRLLNEFSMAIDREHRSSFSFSKWKWLNMWMSD